ncbi:hypothetical protein ABOM_004263 [Aspergillus bombycis]|uniref:Fungal N-terminal domain-containing protein n=1 Tax=Aspergillus bombycis TaxID=109264 RepID=A0A1F8A6Z5_9EURO|nr:hypothetical protein ABOM_004263 [Aspergillus bombycis]OGM47522.1 hypothetical protein ABOM_004263 [Aspergillus bombycis]
MSGIEIVGVVAAALQIAELGSRVSVKLCTLCHRTRHADTILSGLSKEVALTCNVMRQLGASLKEDKDAHLYSAEACSTAETVLDECQKVFDEINKIIDVSTRSTFRRVALVLAEARRDSSLTVLRSNLEKMKSTMLLMLNVIIYAGQLRK